MSTSPAGQTVAAIQTAPAAPAAPAVPAAHATQAAQAMYPMRRRLLQAKLDDVKLRLQEVHLKRHHNMLLAQLMHLDTVHLGEKKLARQKEFDTFLQILDSDAKATCETPQGQKFPVRYGASEGAINDGSTSSPPPVRKSLKRQLSTSSTRASKLLKFNVIEDEVEVVEVTNVTDVTKDIL